MIRSFIFRMVLNRIESCWVTSTRMLANKLSGKETLVLQQSSAAHTRPSGARQHGSKLLAKPSLSTPNHNHW